MAVDVIASIIEVRDSATAPLKTIAGQASTTATALNRADTAAAAVGVTAETKLAPSLNKAGAAARVVGVQMFDVGQQLAAGQAPMMILIQQGGQVAQQFAAMGISLGALAAPLAAGAAAAAALGGAYMLLKADVEATEAAILRSSIAIGNLGRANFTLQEHIDGVAQSLAEATGEYDKIGATQKALDTETRKLAESQREAADAVLALAEAAVEEASGAGEQITALNRLNIARQQHATILQGIARDEATAIQNSADLAEYMTAEAESAEFLRKRDEALREEKTKLVKVVDEEAKMWEELAGVFAKIDDAMALESVNAGWKLAEENAAALVKAAEDAAAAIAEVNAQMEAMMTAGLQTFDSVLSGNLGGAASTSLTAAGFAGGGVVGAGIGVLQSLGAAGADETLAGVDQSLKDLTTGIELLPQVLAELPVLFLENLPAYMAALYSTLARLFFLLPFDMARAAVEKFDAWWSGIGGLRGLASSVAEGLRDWWQDAWASIKAWFSELFDLSGWTVGDRAEKAMNYIMSGEAVTAPTGTGGPRGTSYRSASGGRGSGFGSGTTVNLNMTAAAYHPEFAIAIEKDLKRIFGGSGLRSSPLFGGG